ncbi:MAG TPA: hypothetical protein VIQ60_05105 [Gemmatimonadaceae bacterium]
MRDGARSMGWIRRAPGRAGVGRSLGHGAARLYCAITLVGALGACVQPAAVGRYARAAGKTAAEFPALASDMSASCSRLEAYRASRSGDGWFDQADLEPRCTEREAAVRRAVAVNRVLAGYFTALAGLADDDVSSYDHELDQLAHSLIDDARLDRKQVSAVADLAAFAAEVATDGYRRVKLGRAIEDQNANVATVIDALAVIVGTDYTSILRDEGAGMESFYRTALAESAGREPLAAILVRDSFDEREAALHGKLSALATYVRALQTMKAGHQRLYDARGHLDAKALTGELSDYAARLEDMAVALRKAF